MKYRQGLDERPTSIDWESLMRGFLTNPKLKKPIPPTETAAETTAKFRAYIAEAKKKAMRPTSW
jgi:hypothetical protein